MDMDKNFDAFDNYVMKFDLEEYMNRYKYNHSYRVMKECENIAKSLGLNEEDIYLARLIGLLHDIGRFNQWDNFKTSNDRTSFDHGDYGAEVLFDNNLIKEFDVDEEDYNIIKTAVKYHNKNEIDKSVTDEREVLFSKIVRDADKIDILYAFSTPRILEIKEDDSLIVDYVDEQFFNHKQISKKDDNSCNQKIIQLFSFVYDINFDYTLKKLLEVKYLDKIYSHIKNKKLFVKYLDEANKYMKERK